MKNDFNLLQTEIKKLAKLKETHDNKMIKYENEIFPSVIEKYYKYKLSLINVLNKKDIEFKKEIELNKELYSIEKSNTFLGNYYDIIFNFFNLLRQESKIIAIILINIDKEYQDLLINYITLIFFDNVINLNEKEIKQEKTLYKIIDILIERELDSLMEDSSSNNYAQFLDNSLTSKIIKNFIKFEEVQNYLKNIFYEIILDILEMPNKNIYLEPNRIRDNLFPIKKIIEEIKETNELDQFILNEKKRSTIKGNKNKKMNIEKNKTFNKRNTLNFTNLKSNGILIKRNETVLLNESFDKSFRETITRKNFSTSVFFNESEITNILYNGLTHSRLIYALNKQKIFFNDENDFEYYKPINLDEFLKIKEKNPEINQDYSTYELSLDELNYRYKQAGKYNKYMESFYYNQYKELKKEKEKSYSNMAFLKYMKDNYQNVEAIINQYKINFEKIKYFIDKMIYKILNENNIPFCIRHIIHTINNYFKKNSKKKSRIEINGYLFEFFIGKIIIPFLVNEEIINIITGQKIDKETVSFLFYFSKIIKKIFRGNFFDSLDKNFTLFNIYICEILPYINLIISNFFDKENNITLVKNNEINTFCKIIRHESFIINETIIRIILNYLMKSDNKKIKKLFESNLDLNNSFKLIQENYKDIIQQFEENNKNKECNILGSPFLILIKQEFSKNNKQNKFSLSTTEELTNDKNKDNDILSKIKYSLIKFFELIPNDFFNDNFLLIKNKLKIKIFEEIKNIFMKQYMNNNLIEKEDDIISFIWYLEFFLKYNNKLEEEYILNDFEKLFNEINLEIKNEIINYKNDLSEYYFENIINNEINKKINSVKNLFIYYSQNRFANIIKTHIFNNYKENIEIFIYEKNNRQYLFFNKINNESEMTFVKNEIFYNVYSFIDYFSQHIIKENIISDFEQIENKYKKKLSLIDNINNLFESFLTKLKNYIINELFQKNEENGGIKNETINNLDKDEIEKIINIIEELIDEEIYKRIWKNQKSKEDEDLDNLYSKLSNKNKNDFGINSKYINEEIWENIINLMKSKYNINNYKTPMNKIKCIENIYKILNKSIIIITGKLSDYSVDDIFPIFVYFLSKAKLQLLNTNLNFIKLLIRKKHLMKSSGFSLTQLEMGIQYLKNM